MFDIEFFEQVYGIKKLLAHDAVEGTAKVRLEVFNAFERARNKKVPIVYNIETTNACNMKCKMCPRTTKMTRPVATMGMDLFKLIVDQLRPWQPEQWEDWEQFIARSYDIRPDGMSENHFYLHIIPKVIQLHGYGAPLLDKHMVDRIWYLTARGFLSYFSCNPANINVEKFKEMMRAGLSYVKFSIESVDDERHKEIRGPASNFTEAFEKIKELLAYKKETSLDTTIVITMLDLGQPDQEIQWHNLVEAFAGLDVYIYIKSQDQQWYDESDHGTNSVHWSEICHHPWSSMTIKSDGMVAMCMEDYDNEIVLGDARATPLLEIWNDTPYQSFRMLHFQQGSGIKCWDECDMKTVGEHFPWNGCWHA